MGDPQNPLSSFDLLLGAKQGDARALEELYARYLPRLRRFAHNRLPLASRGALDTGDLVQDTLLRALAHISDFDPQHPGAFLAYLRRMILNRVIDEAQKVKRRPAQETLEDEHVSPQRSPEKGAMTAESLARYERARNSLTPLQRDLVTARLDFGFSAAETAEMLGLPSAGAAQMAYIRALRKLAELMVRA
jgi:RNA polymerase sigma-70 factor (ECF subfamily)